MGLLDAIVGSNQGAIGQIAKQLGIPESLANQAASALLPALAGGLQKNATQPSGLESLAGALGSRKHEQYLDHPETLGDQASIEDGNKILGHILGSKDVSRSVAANASKETGVETDVLKKMLPMLAGVAMGALSKQTQGGSKLASTGGDNPLGMLSGLLGGGDDAPDLSNLQNMAKKLFG